MPRTAAIWAWVCCRSRRNWRSWGPTNVLATAASPLYNTTYSSYLYANIQHKYAKKNANGPSWMYPGTKPPAPGERGDLREVPMAYNILILGASYGSLFATKCLMANHNVTLVCRAATAELINARGTEVQLALKGETASRAIFSRDLAGRLDATTPERVEPADCDLAVLAMQEPQYLHP